MLVKKKLAAIRALDEKVAGKIIEDFYLLQLYVLHEDSFMAVFGLLESGAASNLEPVLRMLCSDWSRHHMIFTSMPLRKLKSTITRSGF